MTIEARRCSLILAVTEAGCDRAIGLARSLVIGGGGEKAPSHGGGNDVVVGEIVVDLGEIADDRLDFDFLPRLEVALRHSLSNFDISPQFLSPHRRWGSGKTFDASNGIQSSRAIGPDRKNGSEWKSERQSFATKPQSIRTDGPTLRDEVETRAGNLIPHPSATAEELNWVGPRTPPSIAMDALASFVISARADEPPPWSAGEAAEWFDRQLRLTPNGWLKVALPIISQRAARRRFVAVFGAPRLRTLLDMAYAEANPRRAATVPQQPRDQVRPSHPLNDLRAQLHVLRSAPNYTSREFLSTAAAGNTDIQPIAGAGVVLIWPLLPKMLKKLGLIEHDAFIDDQARAAAAGYIGQLIWPDLADEIDDAMPNLLCGQKDAAQSGPFSTDESARALLDDTLAALTKMVPGFERLSARDVRALFLRRTGTITREPDVVRICVEADASDVLLRNFPWSTSLIVLPWLEDRLEIQWGGHGQ